MSLIDFVLGGPLNPSLPCRWCRKPIGIIEHYPIPVCGKCFRHAHAHSSPVFWCKTCPGGPKQCRHTPKHWPGNEWERLMTEFPKDAARWAKRLQTMPTQTDIAMNATEVVTDLVAMSQEALRLSRIGKTAEAEALRQAITAKTEALKQFHLELPPLVRQLDKETKDEGE